MRRTTMAALTLVLVIPGLAQAQRDRSANRSYHSSSHESDSRNWMDRCRDGSWGNDDNRARFCEERSSGWHSSNGQSLTVDASPNGGVSVSGWDKDSVDVVAKVQTQAGSDSEARELAQSLHVVTENGHIHVEGPPSRRYSNWSVSFEIRAPRQVNVDLETENGPLSVEAITGTIRLAAQNGPLSLDDVSGDVRAHAQNGPLHVTLTGTHWTGAGLDAETQNGPLVMDIPEGYNAELETGTVNGPMDVNFPITVQGRIGVGNRRRIQTTLGTGGTKVRAVTTNGPAVLRRS